MDLHHEHLNEWEASSFKRLLLFKNSSNRFIYLINKICFSPPPDDVRCVFIVCGRFSFRWRPFRFEETDREEEEWLWGRGYNHVMMGKRAGLI